MQISPDLSFFVELSLGTLGWVFSVHGLIKLLNQLTTPANRVKGELSAKRLRQGAVEMLRRRFSRLQCEIKAGMQLRRGGH